MGKSYNSYNGANNSCRRDQAEPCVLEDDSNPFVKQIFYGVKVRGQEVYLHKSSNQLSPRLIQARLVKNFESAYEWIVNIKTNTSFFQGVDFVVMTLEATIQPMQALGDVIVDLKVINNGEGKIQFDSIKQTRDKQGVKVKKKRCSWD